MMAFNCEQRYSAPKFWAPVTKFIFALLPEFPFKLFLLNVRKILIRKCAAIKSFMELSCLLMTFTRNRVKTI